jgi:CheY-like chemotaxis protein
MTDTARILIVDDDPAMRIGLQDNLEVEGFQVVTAACVREGREIALRERPDLILLDLMLPDGDGINLCRHLRNQGLHVPVIMLTARGEEMDKVLGFEVGADDYVVKPFSLRELFARIHAKPAPFPYLGNRHPGTGWSGAGRFPATSTHPRRANAGCYRQGDGPAALSRRSSRRSSLARDTASRCVGSPERDRNP